MDDRDDTEIRNVSGDKKDSQIEKSSLPCLEKGLYGFSYSQYITAQSQVRNIIQIILMEVLSFDLRSLQAYSSLHYRLMTFTFFQTVSSEYRKWKIKSCLLRT